MAIWLTKDSKVIVQGMTGSEGSKHTRRMLAAGTQIVGGVNPRKAGTTVDFDGTGVPVFGSVAEAMKTTGADVTVIFVPPAFTKDAVVDRQQDPHHRPELPRRRLTGCQQRRHHPGRHQRLRPHRPGLQVGHADLPAHVRAAGHRLLDRGGHRR
jgi:hypothetical protein